MKILFAGQVPKDPLFPDAIEDALAYYRERFAVSDGASESFDSKIWAHLLTTHFVLFPALNPKWLDDVVSDYLDKFDLSQMTWSKESAFERGSFASLLGIEQNSEDGTVDVLAVGDTIAVLLDGDVFIASFPYKHAEEFQQRPELFCTNASLNAFFSSPNFFSRHLKTWSLKKNTIPIILCMTDALGGWALRNEREGHPVWQELRGIENVSELEALVLRERHARNMRIDDVTLVILSCETVGGDDDELSDS